LAAPVDAGADGAGAVFLNRGRQLSQRMGAAVGAAAKGMGQTGRVSGQWRREARKHWRAAGTAGWGSSPIATCAAAGWELRSISLWDMGIMTGTRRSGRRPVMSFFKNENNTKIEKFKYAKSLPMEHTQTTH